MHGGPAIAAIPRLEVKSDLDGAVDSGFGLKSQTPGPKSAQLSRARAAGERKLATELGGRQPVGHQCAASRGSFEGK
jgi:hypothetical protein